MSRRTFIAGPETRGGAIAQDLSGAIRAADGLSHASPGYHGSASGLVKNAIDYLEETARDTRIHLNGIPIASSGLFAGGSCSDAAVMQQLQTVGRVDFARAMRGSLVAT